MNWIEINEDRSNLPKVHVDVLVTVLRPCGVDAIWPVRYRKG